MNRDLRVVVTQGASGEELSIHGVQYSARGEIFVWSEREPAAATGFTFAEIDCSRAACRTGATRGFATNVPEFGRLCGLALDAEAGWQEAAASLRARERQEGVSSHSVVDRAGMQKSFSVQRFVICDKGRERALREEFAAGCGEPIPAPKLRIENKYEVEPTPEALRKRPTEFYLRGQE